MREREEHTESLSSTPPLTTSLPLRETTLTFIFKTKSESDPLHEMVQTTNPFDLWMNFFKNQDPGAVTQLRKWENSYERSQRWVGNENIQILQSN